MVSVAARDHPPARPAEHRGRGPRADRGRPRAAGRRCASPRTRPPSTGSSCRRIELVAELSDDVDLCIVARRRRHDPDRAAPLRRHGRPGLRASTSARSASWRRSTRRPRRRLRARVPRRVRHDRAADDLASGARRRPGGAQRHLRPPQGGPARRDLAYALAGEEIGRVRCDGLVVATPQGSTGYNLANGGPVLAWGVEGYVVSFIAPHSLTARALVVAPSDELTINNALARGAGRGARRRAADARAGAGRGHPRRVRPHATARWPSSRARPSTTACASASAGWRARTCTDFVHNSVPKLRGGRGDARLFRRDPLVDPCVLHELRVENLLLIERAELRLGPGLERAHGRDGRGQDRARPRAGPAARRQAAVGDRAPGRGRGLRRGRVRAARRGCARRLATAWPRTPRSSCWRGASAPRGARARTWAAAARRRRDLRDAGTALLSFYGQHEHRKLMLASAQLEILDGFAGPEQAAAPRARTGSCTARERALFARLAELRERAGARDRELDLLEWELGGDRRGRARRGRGGGAGGRARPAAPRRGAAGAPRPAASARWPAATRTAAAPPLALAAAAQRWRP